MSIVVHGGIEDTSPRRPRPGTGKGQGLDVKRIIAVLKPCELYGDGESCHVVFLAIVKIAKRLLWLKVTSERGYVKDIKKVQIVQNARKERKLASGISQLAFIKVCQIPLALFPTRRTSYCFLLFFLWITCLFHLLHLLSFSKQTFFRTKIKSFKNGNMENCEPKTVKQFLCFVTIGFRALLILKICPN